MPTPNLKRLMDVCAALEVPFYAGLAQAILPQSSRESVTEYAVAGAEVWTRTRAHLLAQRFPHYVRKSTQLNDVDRTCVTHVMVVAPDNGIVCFVLERVSSSPQPVLVSVATATSGAVVPVASLLSDRLVGRMKAAGLQREAA